MSVWTLDGTWTLDGVLTLDGGNGAPVVIPPSTLYAFEDISVFFTDFAATLIFGEYEAQVILSYPGEDLLGGAIASNQYEMEYAANTLPGLVYGSTVTIRSINFTVLQTYPMSDGVIYRARLQT
jgi:hypothetical protein